MTRVAHCCYVAGRVLAAAAIAGGAALLAHLLLRRGSGAVPLLAGFLAHVLVGPKQRRPVFPRRPGALYVYAGITVDRNAGCRGGCITGSTGSGKTLACILPRLHSLCVNQPGTVDPARRAEAGLGRYRVPPWGGLICGEKGNEWATAERLLRCHGRGADLQVLRTRPADAAADWRPAVRFNLAGLPGLPADTYAKLLVDTSLAVEAAHRDEFFVPQARDKIAWGQRLTGAAAARGAAPPPTLLAVLDLLTVPESYREFVARALAHEPALDADPGFRGARYQLEHNYWTQPPEQLGGVRSTVYNVLAPFAEPEIAAVFCADSTLDLRDLERGLVVALALPQRHAVQRRYVTTLLKAFVYHLIAERFDRPGPAAAPPNVILVEQDEWQRHAVRADCDVDIVREAGGAVYAATQSQNAVWLKLGGREAATPLIANLRNRWICQAATEECAEESSRFLSGRRQREASHSHGDAGRSTTVTRGLRSGRGAVAVPLRDRHARDARGRDPRLVVRGLEPARLARRRLRAGPPAAPAALARRRPPARAAALAARPRRHVHRHRRAAGAANDR
jgi:hypothetical protein